MLAALLTVTLAPPDHISAGPHLLNVEAISPAAIQSEDQIQAQTFLLQSCNSLIRCVRDMMVIKPKRIQPHQVVAIFTSFMMTNIFSVRSELVSIT